MFSTNLIHDQIFYNTVLSGIMSITQVGTNTNTASDKNEIHLHCVAHATSNITIHLRSCGLFVWLMVEVVLLLCKSSTLVSQLKIGTW